MTFILQKYSHSYVSSIEKIQSLAKHINQTLEPNSSLIVVILPIKAMINNWLKLADEISSHPPLRDITILRKAGAQASISIAKFLMINLEVSPKNKLFRCPLN